MAEVIWQGEVDGVLATVVERHLGKLWQSIEDAPDFAFDHHRRGRVVITATYYPEEERLDV